MTDKTDALVALDIAIAQATQSRVSLHLTRAKQLREALAAPAEGGRTEDHSFPPTSRRERAVATLLADGWKWDGTAWARPPAASVDVSDAMVSRAATAYVENGRGGGCCSYSAMRDALVAALIDSAGGAKCKHQRTADQICDPCGRYPQPAASVDVDKLRGYLERIKAAGQSSGNDGRPLHEDKATVVGLSSLALELIDSAGGAKGEHCPKCNFTMSGIGRCVNCEQPAEGDGAVAAAWAEGYASGVTDERTSEAYIGIAGFGAKVEPARGNPYTRPAATAVVTDALPMPDQDYEPYNERVTYVNGWNNCRAAMIAAAPAAPKGGVVDEAMVEAVAGGAWTEADMQKPWGAEAASLRHLASDPALNREQAMMLRHCAKRIESTAGIHLRALADMLEPANHAGVLRAAADALNPEPQS